MADPGWAGKHAVLSLSAKPEIVPTARRFVQDCLADWRVRPDLSSDAELVVSELVTNALRHGPPPVYLDISFDGDRVRISVADSSLAEPHPLIAGTWAESGRGLALLEAMAAAWGIEVQPPGKWVWCELHRPDGISKPPRALPSVR
ncbi:MAG: ATP-binding protein [Frankiaceae bacterium]